MFVQSVIPYFYAIYIIFFVISDLFYTFLLTLSGINDIINLNSS
mgnify:FL=1